MIDLVLVMASAYLLGAIPFGLISSRLIRGRDPRQAGSGNIGFTNVLRVVGVLPAVLTLVGDVGKGALAAYLGFRVGGEIAGTACGFLAVFGHCYPIFLRFRGGKAVATSYGVLAVLYPVPGLIAFGLWAVTVAAARWVTLGAVVAFSALPLLMVGLGQPWYAVLLAVGLAALVWVRHWGNLQKRWRGRQSMQP